MNARPIARAMARPIARSLVRTSTTPDALAYIAAVVAAKGSNVTNTQRTAIENFINAEKAAGRWAGHQRIYLPIWGNAAANVICLKTRTTGTWINSPTQAAGYIRCNGTTSYFDSGSSPTVLGLTKASASIWKLVYIPDTRTDGRYSGSRGPGSERFLLGQGGSAAINSSIGGATSPGNTATTNRSGILVASNETVSSRFLGQRLPSGWAVPTTQGTTETTDLLNLSVFFGAWNNNGGGAGSHSDECLGAYGFGLGLSQAGAADFTANLKTLWETCAGLTLPDADAVAYVNAVEAAKGTAVTTAQRIALDNFIKAEKTANRWNLHKRFYFPIWGNAAANAICLRSLTTGTWVNSPTQAAGYVQGNGSTSYFDSGSSPTVLGLSNSSASLWKLVCAASASNSARYSGSRGSGTERFHNGQSSLTQGTCSIGGASSPGTYTDSERNGIIITSNETLTTRFVGARRASGWSILATQTSTEVTPLLDMSCYFLSRNFVGTPDSHSDERLGAYGFSLGMSQANASAWSANLKTLWETCTGLSFPAAP